MTEREKYLVNPGLAEKIEDLLTVQGSGKTTEWRVKSIVAIVTCREQKLLADRKAVLERVRNVLESVTVLLPWQGDSSVNHDWCFFCGRDRPEHEQDCSYVAVGFMLSEIDRAIDKP